MSFMSVPGVLPAKMVVKMILSRGRNQTGKPKEETEKGMYWGRKMGCTPSGAPVLIWERARKRRWNRLKQAKRYCS